MKKLMKSALLFGAVMAGTSAFAQIQDEENVTVTMELVPILQLNMNTPDQVNFVFDEIAEYIGGITQYGATILTVSSTVSWDLFASGTSAEHGTAPAVRSWDQQVAYGAGSGIDLLPLTALELHQFPANINAAALAGPDYGGTFSQTVPGTGLNNVYVSAASAYVAPPLSVVTAPNRYIAGGFGLADYVDGGSYLTQAAVAATGAATGYYFVIDYRIVPGLPAIFPFAAEGTTAEDLVTTGAAGDYANPGVYTMNVKYLLYENQ